MVIKRNFIIIIEVDRCLLLQHRSSRHKKNKFLATSLQESNPLQWGQFPHAEPQSGLHEEVGGVILTPLGKMDPFATISRTSRELPLF